MGYFNYEYTKEKGFTPSKFHQLLWPKEASGNKVNGLGETEKHRPVQSYHKHHPFYPFGLAEQWFIHKCMANFKIAKWYFKHWMTENVTGLGKIANERHHDTPENWTQKIKALACIFQRSLPPKPREACHLNRSKAATYRSAATQGVFLLLLALIPHRQLDFCFRMDSPFKLIL